MFTQDQFNQAFRYCISLTKNEEDAHDLMQTAFEKFLKKEGGHADNPKAYLFRIIRNQYIDDHRRNTRWQFEEFATIESNVALLDLEGLNKQWVAEEEMEYILGLLTAPERELLYLWAVEEYTVQEIADHMEVPKGTLLSRLHRIKKKLRDQLNYPKGAEA